MKDGELPAMNASLPTKVETPSNPALAFSGVTHEAVLPPVTFGVGDTVAMPEHKPVPYEAPRNPESGRRKKKPRLLTGLPEYLNEVPAMEADLPTRAAPPSNPILAFSHVVRQSAPSPLVTPEPVRVLPPEQPPTVVVDTTSPSPVVTPAHRPIVPPKQPPSVVVDTTSPSPVVTDPSPVNTKPLFIHAPRNPESGRRRFKVKLKRKKRIP